MGNYIQDIYKKVFRFGQLSLPINIKSFPSFNVKTLPNYRIIYYLCLTVSELKEV